MSTRNNKARYNTALILHDLDRRGWMPADLVDATGVTKATISRFLSRHTQTAKTALAIANALGYKSPRRYLRREP